MTNKAGLSWTNPLSPRPHGPRDDWLSCEATQDKIQGKIYITLRHHNRRHHRLYT